MKDLLSIPEGDEAWVFKLRSRRNRKARYKEKSTAPEKKAVPKKNEKNG